MIWLYNPLEKSQRYIGYEYMFYDGPHYTFGFWWFNVGWSPWEDKQDKPKNKNRRKFK